jgi:hypothetical protein
MTRDDRVGSARRVLVRGSRSWQDWSVIEAALRSCRSAPRSCTATSAGRTVGWVRGAPAGSLRRSYAGRLGAATDARPGCVGTSRCWRA